MKESLKIEIATISLWHMSAIIVTLVAMTILYMKANRTVSLKAFFKVEVAMLIWMVGKLLKTVAFNVDLRWAAIVLYYGGICLLEVAFLEFGYAYLKGKKMPSKVVAIAYFIALVQFGVVLTNPMHHLFYKTYDFYRDSFGRLFYVHVLIEYTYIITGSIFCAIRFRRQLKHADLMYKLLVGIAIVAPIILNMIYISGGVKSLYRALNFGVLFDVTPIVFTWSLLLFIYVTFKYEFFELSPLMRHEIMHELSTPLCILDQERRLVYVNTALKQFYDDAFYLSVRRLISKGESGPEDLTDAFEHTSWVKGRCYKIFVKKVHAQKSLSYVATFNDITSYRHLEKALVNKRRELDQANGQLEATIDALTESSKSGARNYVARELHDVIGHSLVVTIKLLEVAELYHEKDHEMSRQAIDDGIQSINLGIKEMKAVSHQEKMDHMYNGQTLQQELEQILGHISSTGIQTNFQFMGSLFSIEEQTFDVIRRICTELITNTLKHGNAANILLSVRIQNEIIQIHVVDDGIGCDGLVYGNGLKGIADRLELVKGSVRYTTELSEGFSAYINIPT